MTGPMVISLREVADADLPFFYAQMSDPEAVRLAAFTAKDPSDRAWFDAHWAKVRRDPRAVTRTVVGEDGDGSHVVGHVAVFGPPEEREVTYWIDRGHWGRGAATAALRALIAVTPERPLYARAAADNAGSLRVLEKCGFQVTGGDRDFAHGRGEEVDELVLTLDS